ncbi:Regulator of G-protein signaling 14 [Balamuthia mandrillaris]
MEAASPPSLRSLQGYRSTRSLRSMKEPEQLLEDILRQTLYAMGLDEEDVSKVDELIKKLKQEKTLPKETEKEKEEPQQERVSHKTPKSPGGTLKVRSWRSGASHEGGSHRLLSPKTRRRLSLNPADKQMVTKIGSNRKKSIPKVPAPDLEPKMRILKGLKRDISMFLERSSRGHGITHAQAIVRGWLVRRRLAKLDLEFVKQRNRVITDLFKTELEYKLILDTLIIRYLRPLRDQQIVTIEELSLLFCNIETIASVHNAFILNLQMEMEQWPVVNLRSLATIFYDFIVGLESYTQYAYNYKTGQDAYANLRKKQKFASYLNKVEEEAGEDEVVSLTALTMAPLNRIRKYSQYFEQLLPFAKEGEEEQEVLKELCEEMTHTHEFVNQCLSRSPELQELRNIQEKLVGKNKPGLLVPGRNLIKEGSVRAFLYKHGASKKYSKRYLFLFTDMFILCKRLENKFFRVQHSVSLKAAFLYDVADKTKAKNVWRVKNGQDNYYFCGRSPAEKEEWLKAFKQAVPKGKTLKATSAQFLSVLEHKQGFKVFLEFLKSELSAENLLFWDAVRKLNELERLDEQTLIEDWGPDVNRQGLIQEKARTIYAKYVARGAPREVNIPSHIQSKLISLFHAEHMGTPSSPSPSKRNKEYSSPLEPLRPKTSKEAPTVDAHVFDDAQEAVFACMLQDPYPRFQKTDRYLELVKEVLDGRLKKKAEDLAWSQIIGI